MLVTSVNKHAYVFIFTHISTYVNKHAKWSRASSWAAVVTQARSRWLYVKSRARRQLFLLQLCISDQSARRLKKNHLWLEAWLRHRRVKKESITLTHEHNVLAPPTPRTPCKPSARFGNTSNGEELWNHMCRMCEWTDVENIKSFGLKNTDKL